MEPIIFRTERLTIRQFDEKDTEGYFRLVNNPVVNCFKQDTLSSIEKARKEVIKRKKIHDGSELSVVLKETNEFIGTVFGHWEQDTFSVCWNFLSEFRGTGYAFEAASAYLSFLFNNMNARRIYAYVEDYNISSQRLCEKLKMRKEGLFKEFISFVNDFDGTPIYENTYEYAILKKEWTHKV